MKKVQGSILISDVLFLTAVIITSVIDVILGIEKADAGTQRIKIAYLCRFCGKTASSGHIHLPNVRLMCVGPYNFYHLRRSIGRGKLPKILESKNQF